MYTYYFTYSYEGGASSAYNEGRLRADAPPSREAIALHVAALGRVLTHYAIFCQRFER